MDNNTIYLDVKEIQKREKRERIKGIMRQVYAALEEKGIQEGDTVRMYGLQFDYYK